MRPVVLALAVLAFALLGGGTASGQAQPASPDDQLLVEVANPNPAFLIGRGFDVWEGDASRALVLVSQPRLEELHAAGFATTLVRVFPAGRRRAAVATFGPGGYRGYDAVVVELRAISAAKPSLVSLQDLGPSWETSQGLADRRLWAVHLTGAPRSTPKPAVLFLGTYHAREVVMPELALGAVHLFADDYGRDPLLTYLVDNRDIWIVPIVNPDGYRRVELGAEWWRKNADTRNGTCGASPGTNLNYATPGIDLNRNHAAFWNNGGGATSDPCGETYQGPSAVSEPETQAVQRLIDGLPAATTLISWHSYGNEVLWPWGYRADRQGADPVLDALGGQLARITGYHGGPSGSTLYLTTGELTDWAWSTHGIAGFTIEVGAYAEGTDGNPFTPPYANVPRYWRENRPAALYLARVGDSLTRGYAPDAAMPTVSAPFRAATAAVSAAFVPGNGGAAAGAELFVDAPGVEGSGLPGTLAAGGSSASWTVPVAALPTGRHGAWVRAHDAAGRWGPLSATSFLVGRQDVLLPLDLRAAAP